MATLKDLESLARYLEEAYVSKYAKYLDDDDDDNEEDDDEELADDDDDDTDDNQISFDDLDTEDCDEN